MVMNNNCCGTHCTSEIGEVRWITIGGNANISLCQSCFAFEIAWRKGEIKRGRQFELPEWESLEIYNGSGCGIK